MVNLIKSHVITHFDIFKLKYECLKSLRNSYFPIFKFFEKFENSQNNELKYFKPQYKM